MLLPTVILLAAVHLSDSCFEMDTGYWGEPRGSNGVGRKADVDSALDCQVACQAEWPTCQFWTWNSPNWRSRQGTCYFKSSMEGRVQGTKQKGRVSGPAYCPEGCFQYDTTIGRGKGNGAGKKEDVPSALACQKECQMNDECNFWVWNEPEHRRNPFGCWMKKAATEPSRKRRDEHRVSGPKENCGPPM